MNKALFRGTDPSKFLSSRFLSSFTFSSAEHYQTLFCRISPSSIKVQILSLKQKFLNAAARFLYFHHRGIAISTILQT